VSDHPLDRPVWHALTGVQAHLAARHGDAVRIDPEIGLFAAAGPEGQHDLVVLTRATGRQSWLLETDLVEPPPGLSRLRSAPLTQMVAAELLLEDSGEGVAGLGDNDAPEMFALARATEPGPWERGTHRYGGYYGIREGGRLVAMAGTRLRPTRTLAEVSGVCSYPEVRGRGFARRLMIRVMQDMAARGETPFLHCYSSNVRAIALYRTMGFKVRRELVVSVMELA